MGVVIVVLGEPDLVEALKAACTLAFGCVGEIVDLVPLSGGASQQTLRFDFATNAVCFPLILRKDAASENPANDRATEYALLTAALAHGVPVPRPRAFVTFSSGRTGVLMDRVEGETIPRRILRDARFGSARPRLAAQCGEVLARIHSVPLESLPPLPKPEAQTSVARDAIGEQEARLDAFGDAHPVFELALRWLKTHVPKSRSVGLVHGDFRNGNLIIDETGLKSVLDWELTHLGDPMEDLGWLCVKSWRFGEAQPVGGFGTREALFDGYEKAGAARPDGEAVHFWEVFGTLKWGLICKLQAEYHLKGIKRSMELAALGRRVAETESDLLLLIA